MKKIVSGILILSILISLTGCYGERQDFNLDKEITVISREAGSGTRKEFVELFDLIKTGSGGTFQDITTEESDIVSKTDVVLTNIANNPHAIGYISMGSINSNVKVLSIDGISPIGENILNGSYKISRPFTIATKNSVSYVTNDFIKFILSKDGQNIVAKEYVPVSNDLPAYTSSNLNGQIVISGSSSVYPVMERLTEGYRNINPSVSIEIQVSDSTTGLREAIDGTCDIGMSSRNLKDSEKESLAAKNIAVDGIVLVVNQSNPCNNLTSEQIHEIYSGQITRWRQILIE